MGRDDFCFVVVAALMISCVFKFHTYTVVTVVMVTSMGSSCKCFKMASPSPAINSGMFTKRN